VWTFRGSPVGVLTVRSGDLDTVGRYRGTRDNGELQWSLHKRYGLLFPKGFYLPVWITVTVLFKVISL
jgi:hypothetical protein